MLCPQENQKLLHSRAKALLGLVDMSLREVRQRNVAGLEDPAVLDAERGIIPGNQCPVSIQSRSYGLGNLSRQVEEQLFAIGWNGRDAINLRIVGQEVEDEHDHLKIQRPAENAVP